MYKAYFFHSSLTHLAGSKNLVQNKLNSADPTNNHAQNADLLGFKMPTEERVRKR
jgi:hypothetical protein